MSERGRLPILPRRLPVKLACLYVGVSETKFRELVNKGHVPAPKRIDGNVGWDVRDLDLYVDNLPRDGEEPSNDWEGEAA